MKDEKGGKEWQSIHKNSLLVKFLENFGFWEENWGRRNPRTRVQNYWSCTQILKLTERSCPLGCKTLVITFLDLLFTPNPSKWGEIAISAENFHLWQFLIQLFQTFRNTRQYYRGSFMEILGISFKSTFIVHFFKQSKQKTCRKCNKKKIKKINKKRNQFVKF